MRLTENYFVFASILVLEQIDVAACLFGVVIGVILTIPKTLDKLIDYLPDFPIDWHIH